MKHSEVTRRGWGQGADPECPPGQKQWVTLGPKYRLCGCHSGKPAPDAALRVGPVGRAQKAAPSLCPPRISLSIFWLLTPQAPACLAGLCPHLFPPASCWGSLPPLSLVPRRPHAATATSSKCSRQSAPHGALAGSQEFGVQVLGVGVHLGQRWPSLGVRFSSRGVAVKNVDRGRWQPGFWPSLPLDVGKSLTPWASGTFPAKWKWR